MDKLDSMLKTMQAVSADRVDAVDELFGILDVLQSGNRPVKSPTEVFALVALARKANQSMITRLMLLETEFPEIRKDEYIGPLLAEEDEAIKAADQAIEQIEAILEAFITEKPKFQIGGLNAKKKKV